MMCCDTMFHVPALSVDLNGKSRRINRAEGGTLEYAV
jgi:hypothetical protein